MLIEKAEAKADPINRKFLYIGTTMLHFLLVFIRSAVRSAAPADC
jgi:hypothetical protein